MEGARWCQKTNLIQDSYSKILFDQLPAIWLKPIKKSQVVENSFYGCPVYKTSARRGVLATTGHSTNYVLEIKVPSDRPETFWINRGKLKIIKKIF
jgi:dynein heavy chain